MMIIENYNFSIIDRLDGIINIGDNMYIKLFIKCIVSIICLFIIVKKIGKREIKNETLLDHIISITIGNFIAEIILNGDNFIEGIVAMFILGFLSYLINFITVKNNKFRKLVDDDPALLIKDGLIDKEKLKKNNIPLTVLEEEAREESIKSLKEVKYAVLEANGDITFYKFEDKFDVERNIIIDGSLIEKNMKYLNISLDDILIYLEENNKKIDNTLLLTYQNGKFNLYEELNKK